MSVFTGSEMVKIDIANCFGLDKVSWIDRLMWTEVHNHELENLVEDASEPLLFLKAVKALRKAEQGIPSGHIMFLDATASGLQIMAALSGCKKTAKAVNLINTGKREDVYGAVANLMNLKLDPKDHVDRNFVKYPIMTHYYNKMRQEEFNDAQNEAFYSILNDNFEGAEAVKDTINEYWNKNALHHTWTLPDGHVAYVPITEMKDTRIEVDELNHLTFTYRFEVNTPSFISSSLVPNIIHSIDAYIAREMVRRAYMQGFQMAHIHDAFCAHPNHMQKVRDNYKIIMAEICDMDLLASILSEISNSSVILNKYSNDLSKDVMDSEYALS